MDDTIDLILFLDQDQLLDQLWTVLSLNFYSSIISVESQEELEQQLASGDRYLILAKSALVEFTPSLQRLLDEGADRLRWIFLGRGDLPIVQDGAVRVLDRDVTTEDVVETVEQCAEELGFVTLQGKVMERLVQESLQVEIRVESLDAVLKGETTGVNPNGLGARVNLESDRTDLDPRTLQGRICEVHFNRARLAPSRGVLSSVDESWDSRYEDFIVVKFPSEDAFGFDQPSQERLRELIRQQEERSVRRAGLENWF